MAREVEAAGGVAKEFNTIAVDDGIAMGHDGMLYSLPSRELIADSVEYMVNAHCADALVCISNCDKITPGMLMAAMRLNIPVVFVSGGPMEAGKIAGRQRRQACAGPTSSRPWWRPPTTERQRRPRPTSIERSACPTCGSCSGMFTANSMNCLTEALGLALPGNGSLLATHADRRKLFVESGWTDRRPGAPLVRAGGRDRAAPHHRERAGVRERHVARHRDGRLHQHGAAPCWRRLTRASVPFTMADIDRLSRRVPNLCKVAPSKGDVHMEDVHRAGGIMRILGELDRGGLIHGDLPTVHSPQASSAALARWDIRAEGRDARRHGRDDVPRGAGRRADHGSLQPGPPLRGTRRTDVVNGVVHDIEHAFSQRRRVWRCSTGNIALDGAIVKTAGVDPASALVFSKARPASSRARTRRWPAFSATRSRPAMWC